MPSPKADACNRVKLETSGFIIQLMHSRNEPCPSQPPQILLRLPHIPPNLLFQRFDRRKLDLIAQPIQKINFNFRLRRKFQRMKIQQVGFDGKRIAAKRRTVPDIRDRVKAFVLSRRRRGCA